MARAPQDHFSAVAEGYAAHRPGYPEELFDWLSEAAPGRHLAVDVATGTGQAASGLAARFARVVACDLAPAQVVRASRKPGVLFAAATAERLPVGDGAATLVTVAQAAHWFDHDAFHAEVRRVLAPSGLVAIWSYGRLELGDRVLAEVLRTLYDDVLGPWWPPERRWVDEGYRTLPFPFPAVAAPQFAMTADWDAAAVLAYVGTWSSVARYRASRADDPLARFAAALRERWPAGEQRQVRWPLVLRAGRVDGTATPVV